MPAGKRFEGLTTEEAAVRLERFGPNQIEEKKKIPALHLLVEQFASPLIYILLVAAGVTLLLGEVGDAVIISVAVVVNTIMGFWQEYKAERGLEKLAAVLSPMAVVIREGARAEVTVNELVPGDVVLMEAGERIPADGVLLSGSEIEVNEAVLTGESIPVVKRVIKNAKQMLEEGEEKVQGVFKQLIDRENKGHESVYAGTLMVRGSGVMMVTLTGEKTEVGKIAKSLAETESEPTPLQRALLKLSNVLAVVVGVGVLIIFLAGLLTGDSFVEVFTLAVAVAVSAIPEGLVVSLTAILAIGMQRILKRKALVRKLVAAEVLGSVSVICSDKTGTLTEGKMKVVRTESVNESLMLAGAVASADLKDPMEVALWEWAGKELGEARVDAVGAEYERIDRLAFSSERKYSATLTKKGLFVVGAPELLLQHSGLSEESQKEWEEKIMELAKRGYRLLGLGYQEKVSGEKVTQAMLKKKWRWVGFWVYEDTIRSGVKQSLRKVKSAGIDLKVITGDYRETAVEVMSRLGVKLAPEDIMDGAELKQIADHELDERIRAIRLFCRTSPDQKLKIVESLQRTGEVVAMSGDGVNDAPALKRSNIGIVVSNASDVSKEMADLVLLDNNFTTIVAAVEEGRGIFENLRKVVLYLLSDSFSEIFLVLGSMLLGLPLPITAAQILWVNLANDGLPNLALTVDPKESDLLQRNPRDPEEPIINSEIRTLIGLISLVTGGLVLFSFWRLIQLGYALEHAQTVAFAILGIDSLLYVFSCRSLSKPIWKEVPWKNKWLLGAVVFGFGLQLVAVYMPFAQDLLGTVPLNVQDWMLVAKVSLLVVLLIEMTKWVFLHGWFEKSGDDS